MTGFSSVTLTNMNLCSLGSYLYLEVPHQVSFGGWTQIYRFLPQIIAYCHEDVLRPMLKNYHQYVVLPPKGGNQLLTKSTARLWPHFESWWLFELTGGSPDVVHLIKYPSQGLKWFIKFDTALEANDTDVWVGRNFGDFDFF